MGVSHNWLLIVCIPDTGMMGRLRMGEEFLKYRPLYLYEERKYPRDRMDLGSLYGGSRQRPNCSVPKDVAGSGRKGNRS